MPTIYHPQNQCWGKRPYRTKRDAKRATKAVEGVIPRRMRAYRCPWCSMFHVGHPVTPHVHKGAPSCPPTN